MGGVSSRSIGYHINKTGSQLALYLNSASFTFPVNIHLVSANGGLYKTQLAIVASSPIDISSFPKGLAVVILEDQKGKRGTMKIVK
jgi:hypothetical protein